MTIELIAKKWGNSLAVILPKELVEKEGIKENKKVIIEIVKEADLSDIFGSIKKRKMSGQEAKDLMREGWK